MNLRQKMIDAARLAPVFLGKSASLVHDFYLRQQNENGGFKNRNGRSDLYYSVFASDALASLENADGFEYSGSTNIWRERVSAYIRTYGSGEGLDLVHLSCLARAQAQMGIIYEPQTLLGRMEHFRSRDGGYHSTPEASMARFMAVFLHWAPRKISAFRCRARNGCSIACDHWKPRMAPGPMPS